MQSYHKRRAQQATAHTHANLANYMPIGYVYTTEYTIYMLVTLCYAIQYTGTYTAYAMSLFANSDI